MPTWIVLMTWSVTSIKVKMQHAKKQFPYPPYVKDHYYNSLFFLIGFFNKKIPKIIGIEKSPYQYRQVDLDLPTWLGCQIGPCHFDWQND